MPYARSTTRKVRSAAAATLACALAHAAPAQVILESLPELDGVGVADRRGHAVDQSLAFTNSEGNSFTLESQFDGRRPVVFLLAYYTCPLLCDMMLDSAKTALAGLDLRPGEDYRVLVISFDHTDTTAHAAEKRQAFIAGFEPPLTAEEQRAVVFATAQPEPVRALADQVGYTYRYLPESGEFAHPPAIMFLKPDGTVHTTLMGINPKPRQVELALNEASEGRTASLFEKIVFSCYHYDPKTGQFTPAVMNIMRLGAGGAALLLALVIAALFLFSKRRPHAPYAPGSTRPNAYHAGNNPV